MKYKTHYVLKREFDGNLFSIATCGQPVETRMYPSYYRIGSTWRKKRVTCKNCRKTKIFRRRKK